MSEPEAKVRQKRGDVRGDGKVFWQYNKKGTREEWVTPERFQKNKEKALERSRRWSKNNPDKVKDSRLLWIKKNPEKARESSKRWAKKNPEKAREKSKKWANDNRELKLELTRKWRKINPDLKRERRQKLREKNRELILEQSRRYLAKKRATDPVFKLSCRLRIRTAYAFKRSGLKKPSGIETILGATIQTAKDYLESKFQPGMSWENHGRWHIDHVIPLASAKTEEELISLCRYTNLQPLWATDNIRKGAKMPDQFKQENT